MALLGIAVVVAWILVPLDSPQDVRRVYVLPAAALLAFALACFLLMLGLIAVVALHATREATRGLARGGDRAVAATPSATATRWLP